MRWLLAFLGTLLLVWLASGDARASPAPPWVQVAQPAPHDIVGATFASPWPGVVGAWVQLDPRACGEDTVLQARFLYGGTSYVVERPLPPCPSPPVFVGRAVPALPAGEPAVASHAFVVEQPSRNPHEDAYTQRFPAQGFLPQQAVARPSPLPAIAWASADVGAVAGLWGIAWWRDPSRLRTPSR